MALMPAEHVKQFDLSIYYPMLISILERDKKIIETSPFKLKQPYIDLIDKALNAVQMDRRETNAYMKINKMKTIKGVNDGTFTEFTFIHAGYEDKRRYLNHRLRNRTEELMSVYLSL
jgi:hypothetical protein